MNLIEYKIGKYIVVHQHVHNLEMFYVTIKPLNIIGRPLCSIKCSESEVKSHIETLIKEKMSVISQLLSDVQM